MGDYTSNFGFWYPGSNDFVNPAIDQAKNFQLYDSPPIRDRFFKTTYRNRNAIPGSLVPYYGQRSFNHDQLLLKYGEVISIPPGYDVEPMTEALLSGDDSFSWTSIALINGWNYDGALYLPPAYHQYGNMVELRGVVRLNSYDQIPQNTEQTITAVGAVPAPGIHEDFNVTTGVAAASPFSGNGRITIYNTGQIRGRRLLGTNAAGSVENYLSLDGIRYHVG